MVVSIFTGSLLTTTAASNVTIQGLTFEASRRWAIQINNGFGVTVTNCVIRNIGTTGITISQGSQLPANHLIKHSVISNTGDSGVRISGGNRNSLDSCNITCFSNEVFKMARWDYTYKPAFSVSGVGIRIANNLIYDGPHNAILSSGNDHIVEYNVIHDVCRDSGDVGAWYSGRDWTQRGTIIRYNFFYNIWGLGLGASAIYFDDQLSGNQAFGNIIYNAYRGVLLGGGRDTILDNNIFVNCTTAISLDARGLGQGGPNNSVSLYANLAAVPYTTPPWSTEYPDLVYILSDDPMAPKYDYIRHNMALVNTRWTSIVSAAMPYVANNTYDNCVSTNISSLSLLFVDWQALNFKLIPGSPVCSNITFQAIEWEKIGLSTDTTSTTSTSASSTTSTSASSTTYPMVSLCVLVVAMAWG